ncbi:hypothetical protein CTEN210_06706 [Chaetoceros tenuissimus]|uniref:protein-tyrosine-phosphatase n=1 Tax=Chaetoceros tenuissimus TaxID=426638 RepID=A0AAD3CSF5_9STRA|nr:hypothetical protein CTEN210_06706 [Chaetoceros tenuissimus]
METKPKKEQEQSNKKDESRVDENLVLPGYVEPQVAGWAHLVYEPSDPKHGKIYLGPQQVAGKKNLEALKTDAVPSIGAIVNCTNVFPNHHKEDGITYCRIAINDESGANILVYLDGATEFIHHHISKGQSVLVHCQMGMSRSATVVIAYLMKYKSMSRIDAFHHVKMRRPMIKPNAGFWNQLGIYEQSLGRDTTAELDRNLPFNGEWTERSLAKFQTIGHIVDDPTKLFPEINSQSDMEEILNTSIDYVFGRGVLDSDLEWLSTLCRAIKELGVDAKAIVSSVFSNGSDFMEMWSGEVYPEYVEKIKSATE